MGYNDFFKHQYKVTRLSDSDHEITSEVVTGSRAAIRKQEEFEVQGFRVVILNMTKGVEEYRTPRVKV